MSRDNRPAGVLRKRTAFRAPLGLAACAVVAALARPGAAWEAANHAGLTEQAALASVLHERLRAQFGYDQGLFRVLTIPPADAHDLFEVLHRLNPTHGYVPDGRGRMHALGWLVAGSVVADSPPRLAANHFFDPTTGAGLSDSTAGGLGLRLTALFRGQSIARSGVPAPDWIEHPQNPMGVGGFRAQYMKAVSARTAGERARHLAGALLAAGAIMHVLEDMGSPSHVRNDLAAHLQRLGPDAADLGSRFERIAALAYGRLGVPPPARPASAERAGQARPLRAFFTAADGSGLADRIAVSYFSASTLPRPIDLGGDPRAALQKGLRASLYRPSPAPPVVPIALNLGRAADDRGAELSDARGVCLARYRVADDRLSWFIDDDCALEQVSAILPLVAGYAADLLDTLFRGSLTIESEGGSILVRTGAAQLGRGKLWLYWDDARGVRTTFRELAVERSGAGDVVATLPTVPAAASRVSALYEGADPGGQPLLAAGTSVYPIPAR